MVPSPSVRLRDAKKILHSIQEEGRNQIERPHTASKGILKEKGTGDGAGDNDNNGQCRKDGHKRIREKRQNIVLLRGKSFGGIPLRGGRPDRRWQTGGGKGRV